MCGRGVELNVLARSSTECVGDVNQMEDESQQKKGNSASSPILMTLRHAENGLTILT